MNDILSDVLRAVRMNGAVFFAFEARAPWGAESPPALVMAPFVRPGSDHMIQFHAITKGSCWGGLLDEAPIELHAGDILILPQGERHVMSSDPSLRGEPIRVDLDPNQRHPLPVPMRMGGDHGEAVQVMCGFLGCDARPFNPLLAALPRKIHIAGAARRNPLLSQFFELALAESRTISAGRECVLARLSELMFVEAVRSYVDGLPPEQRGWLAGVADNLVGRALALLHERPGTAWTLELLAKDVGSSRSVLADRFTALVGMPPMQYLTQWRMQLVAELLTATHAGLGEIAERVGYGSEAALSRAFKRMVGVAPAHWRSGERPRSFADPGPLEAASLESA